MNQKTITRIVLLTVGFVVATVVNEKVGFSTWIKAN